MTKKKRHWTRCDKVSSTSSSSIASIEFEKALIEQRQRSLLYSNSIDNKTENNTNDNTITSINGYQYDDNTERYYKVNDNNKKSKLHNDDNTTIHSPYNLINTLNLRQIYAPFIISSRLEHMRLTNIDYHMYTNDISIDHRTINDSHSHENHGVLIIRDHNDGLQLHLNVHQRVSLLRDKKELELCTEKYKSIDNVCWKPDTNENDNNDMTLCFTNDHSHNHCGLIIGNLTESANRKKVFIKDLCKIALEHSNPVQQSIWSRYNDSVIYLVEENGVKICYLNSISPCRYIMRMKSSLKYVCCSDANSLITGYRNGRISHYDNRQNYTTSDNANDVGTMEYAVDYMHCLRNNYSIVVQDIIGTIKVFDQRKPNMVALINKARNDNRLSTQIKRFWVSDNENVLVACNGTYLNFYDLYTEQKIIHTHSLSVENLDYYNNITISSQSPNYSLSKSYTSGLNGVLHSNNYNYQDIVWTAK